MPRGVQFYSEGAQFYSEGVQLCPEVFSSIQRVFNSAQRCSVLFRGVQLCSGVLRGCPAVLRGCPALPSSAQRGSALPRGVKFYLEDVQLCSEGAQLCSEDVQFYSEVSSSGQRCLVLFRGCSVLFRGVQLCSEWFSSIQRFSEMLFCLWSQGILRLRQPSSWERGHNRTQPKAGISPLPGTLSPSPSQPCHPAVSLQPPLGLGSSGNSPGPAAGAAGRIWEPCCVGTPALREVGFQLSCFPCIAVTGADAV